MLLLRCFFLCSRAARSETGGGRGEDGGVAVGEDLADWTCLERKFAMTTPQARNLVLRACSQPLPSLRIWHGSYSTVSVAQA